jgi:ribosomal protein L40E
MPTQADELKKKFKEWYVKFGKSPIAIPVIIALSCLVFYGSIVYLGAACLSNLIAPLFMLGMLWSVNVKNVKKLAIIGVVTTLFFCLLLSVFLVDSLQHVEPQDALSDDQKTMVGTLSPWYGDGETLFRFNLTVTLTNDSQELYGANIIIFELDLGGGDEINYTMNPTTNYTSIEGNITTRVYNFTYESVIPTPINQFLFRANISNDWVPAGEFDELGDLFFLQGPIYKDSWAVLTPILPSAFEYGYIYVFGPYLIIIGMIWWTRRARRMRKEQLEKWEKEHEKADGEKPKDASKVPSLASAMGKDDESFVCSECGADVPSDATVCPKCGEKFD